MSPIADPVILALVLHSVLLGGCNSGDMRDQPKYEPLEVSSLFADQRASRPLLPGTVARGHLQIDDHVFKGQVGGKPVKAFPQAVTRQMLEQGQERYNVFCSHCHDRTGNGEGMVIRRGFPRPPSFHIDRIRAQPVGHLFDVVSNGIGRMPSHREQIPPADRWAIVAYLRALQLSQDIPQNQLSSSDLVQLSKTTE